MPEDQNLRIDQLSHWLQETLGVAVTLLPLQGDASLRQYYRIKGVTANLVMDSPPDYAPIAPFIDVAKRLRGAGLRAPVITAAEEDLGFMLLEDFGDDMLRSHLSPGSGDALMARVLPVLTNMATHANHAGLPHYGHELLHSELQLLPAWYADKHCGEPFSETELALWSQLGNLLIENALQQPQVFVHRDFHSCNLHALSDGSTGIIDFQDAVCGPLTYDLASWLWDRYIHWPRDDIERWIADAHEAFAVDCDPATWRRWCDWMGLQRNLKIIGIFARLNYRDNKAAYLELIPQFIAYVQEVLPLYPELEKFRELMETRL